MVDAYSLHSGCTKNMRQKNRTAHWPRISIVMTTFNNKEGVKRALDTVKKQVYPKNKIEIIVIDNGSKDGSAGMARRYTKNVFISLKNAYENRADGMRKATGEFIYMILEQDMELRSKYFLQKMIKPLMENPQIVASFTREYPNARQNWVTRFISYNPQQCDPLFEFLTTSIASTVIGEKNNYYICQYILNHIPTTTHMMFRANILKKVTVWKQKKDFDHDTIIKLVKAGYQLFAYVPDAGIYHYHAKNLKQLVYKRLRNLDNHYFPYNQSLSYKWIDFSNKKEILKLIAWVIYANLFFPALIRGFLRFLKYQDPVLLTEPVIAIATTDAILYKFVTNGVGRGLITKALKTLFNN